MQNPHPLGQQLPNPVAAAQQQAALAAMGRPGHDGRFMRGICGGHPGSAPSSLAPSATPFVPHTFQSHGGSYPGPSGGPARYSAPGGGLLSGGGHSGDMGMRGMGGMQGGEYGGSLLGQYAPQQYNQAPQQFGQNGYGPPPQQQQRWSSQNGYGGVPQQRAQFAPMPSCGPRGPRGGPGSGPGDGGMGMGAAGMRQHQGAYPSAPARAASPGGKGFASFAGMQQHPSQAFASYTPMTDGSGVPSARSSGPSDEEEGGGSRAGSAPPVSSGRTSPGAGGSDDLAQSLASLKIALTQQQLAAAAGSVSAATGRAACRPALACCRVQMQRARCVSPPAARSPRRCRPSPPQNHEVVISTLHQILKDAMAQQGANATPSSSFGGGGPGDAVAAAACAAAVAAQQGGGAYCSSPNGAVGASFGSGELVGARWAHGLHAAATCLGCHAACQPVCLPAEVCRAPALLWPPRSPHPARRSTPSLPLSPRPLCRPVDALLPQRQLHAAAQQVARAPLLLPGRNRVLPGRHAGRRGRVHRRAAPERRQPAAGVHASHQRREPGLCRWDARGAGPQRGACWGHPLSPPRSAPSFGGWSRGILPSAVAALAPRPSGQPASNPTCAACGARGRAPPRAPPRLPFLNSRIQSSTSFSLRPPS